eukprot:TRINITY_DN15962_c0_g1_i1.p1 TRINITY_DN15962_c0_g1~~TRINITY_DN15962_c0_g1_i1.p1  ORF type:complete len:286 (+),score=60.39 TRINITY_DN15962_c0_g1_i1:74-859(+)
MSPKAKPSSSRSPSPKAKSGSAARGSPKAKAGAAKTAPAAPKRPTEAEIEAQKKVAEDEARNKAEEEAKAEQEAVAKAKAEEEVAKQKAAAEAEIKAAAEAEIKRIQALGNGEVTIRYSHYKEKFPIKDHKITSATIDETYCLTDVMPGCFIHLSTTEPVYMSQPEYVKEDPVGTFCGLMAGETYWACVQQDPEQEKRDQEKMRQIYAGGVATGLGDRGTEGEHCSCGWGAPCTNPMVCKDWDNRFAVALKAGGNPILFQS